jgi:hypothetical protein
LYHFLFRPGFQVPGNIVKQIEFDKFPICFPAHGGVIGKLSANPLSHPAQKIHIGSVLRSEAMFKDIPKMDR